MLSEMTMSNTSWWQNLVKGGIAETICANHFKAARWAVSETGIEHIVPRFAQRDRVQDESNESRIHEHIGSLPDLLVQGSKGGCYLVEVKFRQHVSTLDELKLFVVQLLWKYRHLLFRSYDSNLFKSINFDEWYEPLKDGEPKLSERLAKFKEALVNGALRIEPDMIKLPLLFYIVNPSVDNGLRVHLACPSFSKESGFTYPVYSLHDASSHESNSENIEGLVSDLRSAWQADIQPALDCMFPRLSASALSTSAQEPLHAPIIQPVLATQNFFINELRNCVERIIQKAAPLKKKGVYVSEILSDAEYLETMSTIGIEKLTTIDEMLFLFERYAIRVTRFDVKNEHKRHYIELSALVPVLS